MKTSVGSSEPDPNIAAVRRFLDPAYEPLCETLGDVRENMSFWNRVIVHGVSERSLLVKDAARFKLDEAQARAQFQQTKNLEEVEQLAIAQRNPLIDFSGLVVATFDTLIIGSVERQLRELSFTELIEDRS